MSEEIKSAKTSAQKALDLAQIMEDGKGTDVTVIDVSQLNSWTDYFVIVTVSSSAHWQGLYKQAMEYAKANGIDQHRTNRHIPDGDEWNLIDLGTVVIHLMSKEAREFYELEKLWHAGEVLR